MKTLIKILLILLGSKLSIKGQELYPISIHSSKIDSKILENGSEYFAKFDLSISKAKEISYKGKLIYKCEFRKYYEYLIEVLEGEKNYLIVSPLPIVIGAASPYVLDRNIVFIVDIETGNKYYANFNSIKQIHGPELFNSYKHESYMFMIKKINTIDNKIILLQGGEKVTEVEVELHEY